MKIPTTKTQQHIALNYAILQVRGKYYIIGSRPFAGGGGSFWSPKSNNKYKSYTIYDDDDSFYRFWCYMKDDWTEDSIFI